MEMADMVDHIVIFSGDGDFRRLVEAAQKKGRRVSVVSTIRTQPPMIADDLRRQADNFIELEELKPVIMREGGPRSMPAAQRVEPQNNHQLAQTA
jgi:uncharacterized LabA/DUF88 family protein